MPIDPVHEIRTALRLEKSELILKIVLHRHDLHITYRDVFRLKIDIIECFHRGYAAICLFLRYQIGFIHFIHDLCDRAQHVTLDHQAYDDQNYLNLLSNGRLRLDVCAKHAKK